MKKASWATIQVVGSRFVATGSKVSIAFLCWRLTRANNLGINRESYSVRSLALELTGEAYS